MKWTKKKPTETGWYWCNWVYERIVFVDTGLMFVEIESDENEDGDMIEYTTETYVDDLDCLWSKKLKVPKRL